MTPCLEHVGAVGTRGYGMVIDRFTGRRHAAVHRLMWECVMGPIPQGLQVCHHCDNRRCININHLFLGTQKDNIQDAIRKGRMAKQKVTHCPKGHPYSGENLKRYRTWRLCKECHKEWSLQRRVT